MLDFLSLRGARDERRGNLIVQRFRLLRQPMRIGFLAMTGGLRKMTYIGTTLHCQNQIWHDGSILNMVPLSKMTEMIRC